MTLPPLALVALESLAWLIHPRVRRLLHLALVAALVALIALQVLNDLVDASSVTLLPYPRLWR